MKEIHEKIVRFRAINDRPYIFERRVNHIHRREMLEHPVITQMVTSLPAASGGVKGKRSECCGR